MTRIEAAAKELVNARREQRQIEEKKHKSWRRRCAAQERYRRAIAPQLIEELKRHQWRASSERGFVVAQFHPRSRIARLVRPYSADRVETSLKLQESFVHVRWTAGPAVRLKIHRNAAAKLGITGIGGPARRRRLWSMVHTLLLKRDALNTVAGLAKVRSLVDQIKEEPA